MTAPNGWYGLLAISQEAQELWLEAARDEPVACPRDGEPLLSGGGARDVTYCPYCGYKPLTGMGTIDEIPQ